MRITPLLLALDTSTNGLNWAVLLPIVMGFLSIWYLLPTARPRQVVFGLLGGLIAIVGVGVFLLFGLDRPMPVSAEAFLFAAFSLMAIAFAGLMIAQRNPARAAISFALVVLNVCGLFLLMAAPFLMAASIIIYAGAIIVTFLFVIMLSHQTGFTDANDRSREPSLSTAVGFVLLATLLVVLQRVYNTRDIDELIARADRYAHADNIDDNLKSEDNSNVEENPRLKNFQNDIVAALTRLGMENPDALDSPVLVQKVTQVIKAANGLNFEIDSNDVDAVKTNMAAIRDGLTYLKSVRDGLISPERGLVLSPYGQAVTREAGVPRQLPAANVEALGRVLYTDHLLAIELAGTLLLVATIGTIAIAGGRKEKTS